MFHKPLHLLSSRIVHLQSGVDAEVPNIIHEICCCVVQHPETDGLFRKAGSAARQKELKVTIVIPIMLMMMMSDPFLFTGL